MTNALVILVVLCTAPALIFSRRLRSSEDWRAMVTPLASIMGSGFLISAPLLAHAVGLFAAPAMAVLLVIAYGLGSVIRFNIRHGEPLFEAPQPKAEEGGPQSSAKDHRGARGHARAARSVAIAIASERSEAVLLEKTGHLALAGAYFVTVTYYLQLLSAFVLDRLHVEAPNAARVATTLLLLALTAVGATWGLGMLERLDRFAVGLNLAMVAALLVGLLVHDAGLAWHGELKLPDISGESDTWHAARVLMGLLIVVQGFETSRFLGSEHSRELRIRSMRQAQLVAAGVYLLFLGLATVLMGRVADREADVTAVLVLVAPVATVLPLLVTLAAVGSQFAAAVADDSGAVGLLESMTRGRVPNHWLYLALGGVTIAITWLTDVLGVISLASRAFAVFYALQCAVAVAVLLACDGPRPRWPRLLLFVVLGLGCLAVASLGLPAA